MNAESSNGNAVIVENSSSETQENGNGEKSKNQYGMFSGVFTPTLLTILGVILYLREGTVVGNAGLVGAWLIITIAFAISACTALSMSSITTNIRIGAGGAYSIISKSLGLEVGGGIGIPFYLAQGLATAMYIIGFREGWMLIFPEDQYFAAIYVDFAVFLVLFVICFISTSLAFKIQYLILLIIVVSLISIAASVYYTGFEYSPTYWGDFRGFPENGFKGTNFWYVFAVFFPAATGIMAGANMSGDLENPRKSVPFGTLAAIGVSYVVYMLVALWLSMVASPKELIENYEIVIQKSAYPPAVIAGLLGATFSSGLSCLVGAPRILQALAKHGVTFFGKEWLETKTDAGEPRNALWLTGILVCLALLMRELTAVAAMITMFLLLTYAVINSVVLIKQSLGLVSFRPTLKIPRFISAIGMLGCLIGMFIINPLFSAGAILVVTFLYYVIRRRDIDSPFGDVRSGLLISMAEFFARRMAQLAKEKGRSWKPNLLIPIEDAKNFRGKFRLIYDIAYPKGSVHLVGLTEKTEESELEDELPDLIESLEAEDIFAYSTLVSMVNFKSDLITSMQAMSGSFLRPNILFLPLPAKDGKLNETDVGEIIMLAKKSGLGVILFAEHQQTRLGHKHKINVWVRDQSPNWDVAQGISTLNLSALLAYQIQQNWAGDITVLTAIKNSEHIEMAEDYLSNLIQYARLPSSKVDVCDGDFDTCLEESSRADLNIFGLGDEVDFDFIRRMVEKTESTCIFVKDSGEEDVLA